MRIYGRNPKVSKELNKILKELKKTKLSIKQKELLRKYLILKQDVRSNKI